MKTANCALIADTSKFETPIERAKTKLVAFGATIKQVSSYAQIASGVFNKMVGFSEKINTIAKGFRNVADGVKAVQSIIQNMPSLFEKIKTTAQGAYDKIRSISPALAKIGVVAGVAGIAIFGVVKAVGALKGVGGGAFSSISSAIKNVGSVAGGVAGSIKNVFGGAVGALGGIVGLGAKAIGGLGVALGALDHFFKIGIMSAIQLGDQYDVLSKRTGASIPFLYDFGKILKNNGMDASSAGTAILSLQRSLGGVNELGQPTNEMIKRLGLNFADLQKLSPEQLQQAKQSALARRDMQTVEAIDQRLTELASEASMSRGIAGAMPQQMADGVVNAAGGGILAFEEGGPTSIELPQYAGDPALYKKFGERAMSAIDAYSNVQAPKAYTPQEEEALDERSMARAKKLIGPSPIPGIKTELEGLKAESKKALQQGKGLAALAAMEGMLEPGGALRGAGKAAKNFVAAYAPAVRADQDLRKSTTLMNINLANAQRAENMGLGKEAMAYTNQAIAARKEAGKAVSREHWQHQLRQTGSFCQGRA